MRRWHKDRAHAERQQKLHRRDEVWMDIRMGGQDMRACICDFQIGRFRKSKGRGCRKTYCNCKIDKNWPDKRRRTLLLNLQSVEAVTNYE